MHSVKQAKKRTFWECWSLWGFEDFYSLSSQKPRSSKAHWLKRLFIDFVDVQQKLLRSEREGTTDPQLPKRF